MASAAIDLDDLVIAEECARAGIDVRIAEPAETRQRQERKRRAKTDQLDARLLRELLMEGRLPESWIAPPHILDLRAGPLAQDAGQ